MFKRMLSELVKCPSFVAENTPIVDAASLMIEKRTSLLAIVSGRRIIGFVTERNLCHTLCMDLDETATVAAVPQHSMVRVFNSTFFDEAVKRMLEGKACQLLVMHETRGVLAGIVTAEVLIDALAVDFMVDNVTCGTLVRPDTVRVETASPVREVLSLMRDRDVCCVVAVREDKPIGIFTERDAIARIVPHRERLEYPLAEVMSHPVISVPLGAMVYKAILFMRQRGVRRVAVVDDAGALVGMLTPRHILAYARRLL